MKRVNQVINKINGVQYLLAKCSKWKYKVVENKNTRVQVPENHTYLQCLYFVHIYITSLQA